MCVLSFLQAANGTGMVAPSLSDFIHENIPTSDTAFYNTVKQYSSLDLDVNYTFNEYPEKRQRPKTLINAITIAAVSSKTIDEMLQRCIGILPNEQWLTLKEAMLKAEPYYDRLIGIPYKEEINNQLQELQKLSGKTDDIFNKLKHFYGSTWSDDIPFTVSIYPVPGRRGTTTATPHSNSLVLAVLTKEQDYNILLGIGIHEICHVLYDEQPLALQQSIDSLFIGNKSSYSPYAYDFIDEALATACGNGWAYKLLSGHEDKTQWYANEYINGFAHAIYPMVEEYISSGKQIDKAFIDKAIIIFGNTFPDAASDYKNLFNRINLYTDADNNEQYQNIFSTVNKHFRVTGCWGSYPIADTQTTTLIEKANNTLLFVIYTNNDKNTTYLKSIYPQLVTMQPVQYGIFNFIDDKKRPVIIINAKTMEGVDAALKKLSKKGSLKKDEPFIPL
jgi:hypothetical protein